MNYARFGMLLFTFTAVWFLLAAASEQKRVEILHASRYLTDDSSVTFEVRIPRDAENRSLAIAAIDDTGDTVRESDQQLDQDSPTLFPIAWLPFDAGNYTLIAEVYGSGEKPIGIDRWSVEVIAFRP